MPPPAASVDFRPTVDVNSVPPTENGNPNFPSSFNAGCSPSGPGRVLPRTKPRLVKQRRSSKAKPNLPGGLNPFGSVYSSSSSSFDSFNRFSSNSSCCDSNSNSNSNNGGGVGGGGFVFGFSNSSNGSVNDCNISDNNNNNKNNVSVAPDDSEKAGDCSSNGVNAGKCEVNGVSFKFSAAGSDQGGGGGVESGVNGVEVEISDGLKKLNIESDGKVSGGGDTGGGRNDGSVGGSSGGDGSFVFQSGEVRSVAEEKVPDLNGNDEGVNDGESSGLRSHLVDEDVFVFGSNGRCSRARGLSSESSSFSADFDGARLKEDVSRTSFSFTSVDAQVGEGKEESSSVFGERKTDSSAAAVAEESRASASEFKLPEFDAPLSFSVDLSGELGRKPAFSVKTPRALRDKHSKKGKGKAKHFCPTKQQPLEKPLSDKGVTLDKEAAESYSPMDFSPYEETAATDEQQSTGKPDAESDVSADVNTEWQPDLVFTSNRQGLEGATISEPGTSSSTNFNSHNRDRAQSQFNVFSEGQEKLTFSVGYSENHYLFVRRQPKKYRLKTGPARGKVSATQGLTSDGSPISSRVDEPTKNSFVSASKGKHETNVDGGQGCKPAFSDAERACDKWRQRGNDAYEKGNLSKAEQFYTWGINCIPPGDFAAVVFTPLVCCYSNRAAARMALGRVREAIEDCFMAVKLDPTFHRAQMRAANCYLQLGELEDAMDCFSKILDSPISICLDRQVIISASEGIQKSKKVVGSINHAAELLNNKTSAAAANALDLITEAMSISVHSEKLLEMKAKALCMLQKHDEAIALCQQTLDFAKKNSTLATLGNHKPDGSNSNVQPWRHSVLLECHFHLGRLEVALELIEKLKSGDESQDTPDPLAVTIHELLREKSAGNIAFQSGKHVEAVEHYTTAISNSTESRPFAAVCLCNRAAAHQALGHIADAISDCSIAIALDETYAKAVSRRATLHEMIRDYKQAAADLQRLVSLMQKLSKEKAKQSGSDNGAKEVRQVQRRLSSMEEEAKRDIPLDLYLILGVSKSDSASEIKKAYRKAALRHHPDKAGQSLVSWKDIAELVHMDSDRLFKMIGEAYAVLSDTTKREEYDHEEEMRKALKERSNFRSTSRRHSEYYYEGFPYERSSNRRNWQDGYRYSYSHKRW